MDVLGTCSFTCQVGSAALGMLTSSSKATSLWYRFKLGIGAGRVQQVSSPRVSLPILGMRVTINVPKKASLNLTSVIKPLFDGIVAAFNRHDGSYMELVTVRIATELGIDHKEVACLLEDETMSMLGPRRLVWPWRNSIQWNPSDDLLVAGELFLAHYASEREWELSGELFEVHRAKP